MKLLAVAKQQSVGSEVSKSLRLRRALADQAQPTVRYPYFASLFKRTSDGSLKETCGGALIAPSVIATDASCIDAVDVAYLGLYDSSSMEEGTLEVFNIVSTSNNALMSSIKDASKNVMEVGLGLLFLDHNATSSPITINTRADVPVEGQELVEVGRDSTKSGAVAAGVLTEANVSLLSQSTCEGNHVNVNFANMTCVSDDGLLERGGLLIVKGEDAGKDVLVGVATSEPGVYSSVLKFLMPDPNASTRIIKNHKLGRCWYEYVCDYECDYYWCDWNCGYVYYC